MEQEVTEPLDPWVAVRKDRALYFNATAVAIEGDGVLLLGPSGSGKSSTALALMAHGAQLISDDGVWLEGNTLTAPASAPSLIEARGVGLLNAGPMCAAAPLALVVDLSRAESARLPPRRFAAIAGQKTKLIRAVNHPTLAPVILQLLRQGLATL